MYGLSFDNSNVWERDVCQAIKGILAEEGRRFLDIYPEDVENHVEMRYLYIGRRGFTSFIKLLPIIKRYEMRYIVYISHAAFCEHDIQFCAKCVGGCQYEKLESIAEFLENAELVFFDGKQRMEMWQRAMPRDLSDKCQVLYKRSINIPVLEG